MRTLAVVTGASAGIGRAIALTLAGAGLEVVAVARRADALAAMAAQPHLRPVPADVTTPEGRQRVVEAVGERRIGVLVHGAGVFPRGPIAALGVDEWRAAMATNFESRLWLVLDLLPRLRGGRVLFIGSDAATKPRSGGAAYSVSKAASAMLWRCLSLELGGEIAFGMFKPGLVATDMLEESLRAPRKDFPAGAVYQAMRDRGETVAPETVARFTRWLLLDTSREEFSRDAWDIRDAAHHPRWLEGPLYTPTPLA